MVRDVCGETSLKEMDVQEVVTGASAGGVNRAMRQSDYVIPDDFIDQNIDRPPALPVKYLDGPSFAFPRFVPALDETLREILIDSSRSTLRAKRELDDVSLHPVGCVCQARGGRFESISEIQALRQQGADLVTHNVVTEFIYARQLGIHCAALMLISNPAEGIRPWSWKDLHQTYQRLNPVSVEILRDALPKIAAIPPQQPRTQDPLREHPPLSYKGSLDPKFQ